MALKPVNGVGRNMPAIVTLSPGVIARVSSPLRCTVIVRGTCPTGTWSAGSWMRASWNLVNFDPRVCACSTPARLFTRHCSLGHSKSGM